MFQALDSFLKRIAAEGEIWFCPNPGNAGDALIAAATWQRFRSLGIAPKAVPRDGFDATGKIVLYGGGGNLVPMYSQASDFLRRHHRNARRIVLLPHTVDGHEDLLAELGPNATLFCREAASHFHCLRHASAAEVVLSHDLALGLDAERLPPPRPGSLAALLLQGAWTTFRRGRVDGPGLAEIRNVLRFARRHGIFDPGRTPSRTRQALDAFRLDAESAGSPVPEGNIDVSAALELRSYRRRPMEISARYLLGALRGFRRVRTDRLHVCIAATLLGIDVEFHANSYFKCRAIWMHSLKERFPSIRWVDGVP